MNRFTDKKGLATAFFYLLKIEEDFCPPFNTQVTLA